MSLRALTTLIIGAFILLYPFVIFFGMQLLSVKWLSLIILCLFGLRAVLTKNSKNSVIPAIGLAFLSSIGLGISILGMVLQNILFIKLYPVAINLALFIIFASSLYARENILYKFAQKVSRQPLPAFVRIYTQKTTIVWCLFFTLNAFISCYTALFSPIHIWTLYNGLISYIAMGILFGIEFSVRTYVKRKHEND
ncbi:hypothetical protein [Caedibacter taeniospiralis]|jgi:uncharacterized membrane protein|uniref:hypothetical protein n=1 Tax=Caedibacter taeniospiralis TaxID=28907 RepID=UPI0037C10E8C